MQICLYGMSIDGINVEHEWRKWGDKIYALDLYGQIEVTFNSVPETRWFRGKTGRG